MRHKTSTQDRAVYRVFTRMVSEPITVSVHPCTMYILYGVEDQGRRFFVFHRFGFVHAVAHPVYV